MYKIRKNTKGQNGNLLIIGAGGVSRVATFKVAKNIDIFKKISLASRTKSKCDEIAKFIKDRLGVEIETHEIDAMMVTLLSRLIKNKLRDLLNLALPYQDLSLMDACLKAGIHYIDTANYEHPKNSNLSINFSGKKMKILKKRGF